MVSNRIKVLLAEREISAKALADGMPECCSPAIMSYITNGKVLPTKQTLGRMCFLLGCEPTDLYDVKDLDLLSGGKEREQSPCVVEDTLQRDLNAREIAALELAVKALGYSDLGDWVRDMWRATMLRYYGLAGLVETGAINLSEVILHEGEVE